MISTFQADASPPPPSGIRFALDSPGAQAVLPPPDAITGSTIAADPSMARRADGTYFVYSTAPRLSIKTSTDRIHFNDAGSVFPDGLPWAAEFTDPWVDVPDRNIWAPDVTIYNGTFFLYYAASSLGSRNSAIFLATSQTGESGSFTNRGGIIASCESDNFNAIDPQLLIDGDSWTLVFGSFNSGIKQINIQPNTGVRLDDDFISLAARPNHRSRAIEGAFMHRHGQFYYLFVSYDLCCKGVESTYSTVVGRSTSRNGPFYDRTGIPMLQGGATVVNEYHSNIIGPGGQSVMTDGSDDILIYHYYDANNYGAPTLGINVITYSDAGWPELR